MTRQPALKFNTKPKAKRREFLTIDVIRKLLEYNPKTGVLTWKERPIEFCDSERAKKWWDGLFANRRALESVNSKGYCTGAIFAIPVKAHRVAFAIYHGRWPSSIIDHINGVRIDNRICNLREVTDIQNSRSQKLRGTNTSGVMGVCWNARRKKWICRINNGVERLYLGAFSNFSDAVAVRNDAEMKIGFYENHGRTV
jgi:hypothetical protein